jgi:hypothetical protein
MFRRFFVVLTSGLVTTATFAATAPLAEATELSTGVVLHDGAGDVWRIDPAAKTCRSQPQMSRASWCDTPHTRFACA